MLPKLLAVATGLGLGALASLATLFGTELGPLVGVPLSVEHQEDHGRQRQVEQEAAVGPRAHTDRTRCLAAQ